MLTIVANLLDYKMAGRVESLDKSVRDLLHTLYNCVHVQFPDVELVAVNKGIEGNSPHQIKGQLGHLFVKKVVGLIDEIYANHDHISLGEILDTLTTLMNLINDNQYLAFNNDGSVSEDDDASKSQTQFPHVAQFIGLLPGSTQLQRKNMYAKIPKGLHRAYGISRQAINYIKEIIDIDPDAVKTTSNLVNLDENMKDLGAPPVGMSGLNIKKKFVNEWGPRLFNNPPTLDHISKMLTNKPELNGPFTNFLNSLNRGGDGGATKELIISKLNNVMDSYSYDTPNNEEMQ